jgi:hypothetical protein
MRIAHITTDEASHAIAVQVAKRLDAGVTMLGFDETAPLVLFDAVLYDLDRIPVDQRRSLLRKFRSNKTAVPMAVYGYSLSEGQADWLRFHGVAVAQRLHPRLIRTVVNAARQQLAAVPPDDAITELTWVNLDASAESC